ncbi:deoxyribodipyrimidine photo-lyase [Sphingobacterium sp. UT-1RO-CII-1]|uniref:cryptochrome/photolyase family protein n=1 Tax=Sphingobacterium sp. UT-1RO-CII-1 TaxID=2995225 RepID=UPI00227B25AA|nr:deoxyribodipyrimidine photo-lyase [Sphingobacterium sp. UT-1RO-CII-1]MCY4778599.1 deoxyribodipyrimidine photo-lyase [Sphingobacterium sp. UT-1RO-CII-1]
MVDNISVFWFRRDLRIRDNRGLAAALRSGYCTLPIFIFDTNILSELADTADRRVDYILQALKAVQKELQAYGSDLRVYIGDPLIVWKQLLTDYHVKSVYCNTDYEPAAIRRDAAVVALLQKHSIPFYSFKDHVIFDKAEVVKQDGSPYTVFTPYSRKWKSLLSAQDYAAVQPHYNSLKRLEPIALPTLSAIGFTPTRIKYSKPVLDSHLVKEYALKRDYPSLDAGSGLGIALRFGTLSVREAVAFATLHSETWLNQLIWREFFMQILYHYPLVQQHCFKAKYENIPWQNNEDEFQLWCSGNTGYPLVDAGMNQLNQTGFMHNRVRMVVASFLTKHLLIDWRWGEAYFAQKLNDYDLALNNGNWQWAAGCGCDAVPYFRVFNPSEQSRKFDPHQEYIKRWNPTAYTNPIAPIVDHSWARERALRVYKLALHEG